MNLSNILGIILLLILFGLVCKIIAAVLSTGPFTIIPLLIVLGIIMYRK